MRPATFFAIFIPLLSTIIVTVFIAISKNRTPDPKTHKVAYALFAVGLLLVGSIVVGQFI